MVKISVEEDDEWQSAFISDDIYDSLDVSTPDNISNDNNNNFFDLFEKYGIGSFAARVDSATGAESLDDLMLLDGNDDMIDEAARNMGMKLIHKAKLKKVLKYLHEKKSNDGDTSSDKMKNFQQKEKDAITGKGTFIAQTPTECTVVCIDRSFSMGSAFEEELSWGENSSKTLARRSRMDAVKQIFYAFRDRTETLGSGSVHKIGLLSFDDNIEAHLNPTFSLGKFEEIIDDIEKRGSTAIYSAISKAAQMLGPFFKSYPNSDLRILCLTDGENNHGIPPEQALLAVNSIGATVDAIIVGDSPDSKLRKIVSATGGECYQITSLTEGFQLMEAEGVVSLRYRRGDSEKPAFKLPNKVNFSEIVESELTKGAKANDKSTKTQITGNVSELSSQFFKRSISVSGSSKRIMKEMTGVKNGSVWSQSGEGIHFFPNESNISQFRVLVEGPKGSPFEGGVFLLNVFAPIDYPFRPPKVIFGTPIYHCNVSESGQVCLDMLNEGWNPAMTIPKVIETISMLMKEPDPDNALRQLIAEEVLAFNCHGSETGDGGRYMRNAMARTKADASRTIEEWKDIWKISGNQE